jgi:hypothetical protein
MAGAGYKLFATGDVLTAAQVNTYLMQQTVMVFASSAARTTALSGVLAEGMVSYLQDSNTLEVYDGAAWVGATGDITGLTAGTGISISSATGPVPTITNSMATEITAKGDLIVGTGSGTFDNLAAGSNGDTIVADSSTSTGLRYQATNAAGKNAVINGAFEVWQRGTSFTATGYSADRWYVTTPGSNTWSRSTDAPAGFNYSMNWVSAGSFPGLFNYVELPVTGAKGNFVGTWVYSFYAKASTATSLGIGLQWMDGSSRANNVVITGSAGSVSLSTSWQRFSITIDFNSSSPVGTNKAIEIGYFLATGGATINITGCQLEIGSVATAFTRAGGTIQGELAACQRYYWRLTGTTAYSPYGTGLAGTTSSTEMIINFPTMMRTSPSAVEFSNLLVGDGATGTTVTTVTIQSANQNKCFLIVSVASGLTQFRPYNLLNVVSLTGHLGFTAEL